MLSSYNRDACVWSLNVQVEGNIHPDVPCFEIGDTPRPKIGFTFLDFPRVDIPVERGDENDQMSTTNTMRGKSCKFELNQGLSWLAGQLEKHRMEFTLFGTFGVIGTGSVHLSSLASQLPDITGNGIEKKGTISFGINPSIIFFNRTGRQLFSLKTCIELQQIGALTTKRMVKENVPTPTPSNWTEYDYHIGPNAIQAPTSSFHDTVILENSVIDGSSSAEPCNELTASEHKSPQGDTMASDNEDCTRTDQEIDGQPTTHDVESPSTSKQQDESHVSVDAFLKEKTSYSLEDLKGILRERYFADKRHYEIAQKLARLQK